MVNINTSGAQSGRDFSYGASPTYPETFFELYERTLARIDVILTIKDQTSFNIELNKLRKDLQKLINDHFKTSISQRKSQALYQASAEKHEIQLAKLSKKLKVAA
ncbi:MAG: hypothetical protein ACON35_06455 [Candidatus Marinamargulisbacteria bacterium]